VTILHAFLLSPILATCPAHPSDTLPFTVVTNQVSCIKHKIFNFLMSYANRFYL
jgi:hypothetical protein